MQLAHKVRTPYWTQLPEQHDTLYTKASYGEAGGLDESAAEGTMPDAATFQKDKKESNARSLFCLRGSPVHAKQACCARFSAPAKRCRRRVRLASLALPPGAALRRHLYLGLSP